MYYSYSRRWEGSGGTKTQGMTVFYSGGEKHEKVVGFIIKNNILPNMFCGVEKKIILYINN